MTFVELFSQPGTWCQHANAKSLAGECEITSPDACQWCLNGAICKVYGFNSTRRFEVELKIVEHLGTGLIRWNDAIYRTQAQVLELCKEIGV